MNSFDAVVYLGLMIAVVIGFNTGLLRSAIAIFGLSRRDADRDGADAAGVAAARRPACLAVCAELTVFFGVFLVTGMVLGKLARLALDDAIGPQAGHRWTAFAAPCLARCASA